MWGVTQVVRSINLIAVKIVDNADPTSILVALIRLLRESVASATANVKYIELVGLPPPSCSPSRR